VSAAAPAPARAESALTLPRLAQWADGDLTVREVVGGAAGAGELLARTVRGAAIDTRALEPGMLFVPLPGSRHDGHEFLAEAFARGAAAALCARDRAAAWAGREPGPLVVVDDVTVALARLAHAHRRAWPGWLLCVTGSSGKTTTRELVAAALGTAGPVLATPGNLNNQWGLPLTLLRLEPAHRAAVVEIGANHPGEVADLARIAAPDAAVITNAGSAHLEGFGSLDAIAREKASLGFALEPGRPLFAGADSPRLVRALRGVRARLVLYGWSRAAAVRPRDVWDLGADGSRVEVDGFPAFHLRLVGRHQVANALAALAVARALGLDPAAVARALEGVRPVGARMQVRRVRGATLLVDCYNANPESTGAALETLAAWPAAGGRIAVLGDMLELGPRAAVLHRAVGARVRGAALWTVGAHAADLAAGARRAGAAVRVFADQPVLAAALRDALAPGVVVLLKASRGAALEQVLAGLEGRD
jgi:UDP-N-acetylmuramoyl-tripeptide--D-alanyl-D-alanine ligase